jgi:hypothetical protein
MKTRYNIQYHVLAILAAVVVIALRWGDIRGYSAWQKGTATATAQIDDISSTRQVRVIRYSFLVNGKTYTDEIYSRTGFVEGGTAQVTYAVSDPYVSSLQPEKMAGLFRNSVIIVIVAALPMLLMWLGEIVNAVRKKPTTPTVDSIKPKGDD